MLLLVGRRDFLRAGGGAGGRRRPPCATAGAPLRGPRSEPRLDRRRRCAALARLLSAPLRPDGLHEPGRRQPAHHDHRHRAAVRRVEPGPTRTAARRGAPLQRAYRRLRPGAGHAPARRSGSRGAHLSVDLRGAALRPAAGRGAAAGGGGRRGHAGAGVRRPGRRAAADPGRQLLRWGGRPRRAVRHPRVTRARRGRVRGAHAESRVYPRIPTWRVRWGTTGGCSGSRTGRRRPAGTSRS